MNTFYWNDKQILWIWILLFLFRTLLRLHHPIFLGNCKMQKIINVSVIITGDYKRLRESFVIYHRCQLGRQNKKKSSTLFTRAVIHVKPCKQILIKSLCQELFLFCWLVFSWRFPDWQEHFLFLRVNGVFPAFPVDFPRSRANYCKGRISSSFCSHWWPSLSFFLLLTNSPVFSETVRTEWESWFIHSI